MSDSTHPSHPPLSPSVIHMGSIDALHAYDDPVELILLGTGTSSTLPHVDCLTAPPGAKPCRTCLSTLTPEGWKNKRRNTSAVLRVRGRDGLPKTIVIDVGKSFMPAAVEWFPKYGLRHIDAVLITHAHADAMNGLDDLRGWTLGGAIQQAVDIYLSAETFEAVKIAFPYLVRKEFASGGGDVPEFNWHPYVTDREPFEIGDTGITVKPYAVPHGFCGAKPVKPVPSIADQIAAAVPFSTSSPCGTGMPGTPTTTGNVTPVEKEKKEDFLCLGFTVQNAVTYISDCSKIPDDVLADLLSSPIPVLVLDCLRLKAHLSHLSLAQAVEYARQLRAQRTYLLGFSHEVSHEEYEVMLRAVGGHRVPKNRMTEMVTAGLDTLDLGGEKIWIRPAFDGLQVFVSDKGEARDTAYYDYPEE